MEIVQIMPLRRNVPYSFQLKRAICRQQNVGGTTLF